MPYCSTLFDGLMAFITLWITYLLDYCAFHLLWCKFHEAAFMANLFISRSTVSDIYSILNKCLLNKWMNKLILGDKFFFLLY